MGTLHHLPELKCGAMITKNALAHRLGRSVGWVACQGMRVRGTTGLGIETWEAYYKPGGRTAGYTLLSLEQRAAG